MSKTKKVKLTLAALLMAIFMCCTGVALGTLIPARADDKVLSENTAEYSFVNDTSYQDGYDTLWDYSRSTNVWESSGDTAQNKIETTLTLKITKEGVVAFQWLPSAANTVESNKGDAYLKVIKTSGGSDSEVFTKDTASIYERYETREFSETETISVAKDDVLKFVYKGNYSSNSGYIKIKGLQVPTDQITLTAEVEAGSQGHGSIKTENGDEQFDGTKNTLTVQRGYDESVTFTAVPDEGYVAYWRRNGSIISVVNDNAVTYINDDDGGESYYFVYFVQKDSDELITSYDEPQQDKMGWTQTEKGFKLDALPDAGEETFDTVSVIYEFVGARYLSFNYLFLKPKRSNCVSNKFLIDGKSASVSLSRQGDIEEKDTIEPTDIIIHIDGEGYHYVEFQVYKSGSIGATVNGGEIFEINDVEFTKQPPTTQIHVKYNSRLADLYVDETLQPAEQEGEQVDALLTVPRANQYTIKLTPKTQVTSTLDPSKTTTVKWITGTANAQYYHRKPNTDNNWEYIYPDFKTEPDGSVQIKILQKTKSLYAVDARCERAAYIDSYEFTLDEGQETLIFDLTYKEVAIAPEITATKSSDSEETPLDTINDGERIDFPFGRANTLTLTLQKFADFSNTDYSIVVDGEEYNEQIQDYTNFVFVYQLTARASFTISYLKEADEEIDYSDWSLSFSLKENVAGG